MKLFLLGHGSKSLMANKIGAHPAEISRMLKGKSIEKTKYYKLISILDL